MLGDDIDYHEHVFVLYARDLAGNNATIGFNMSGADGVACSGEPPYVRPPKDNDDSLNLPWNIILLVIVIIIGVAIGLGYMAWRMNKGGRSGSGKDDDVPSEPKRQRRAKD